MRDRDASRRGRRRQDDLDALARRKGGGKERRFLVDALAGGVRDELREPPAPVEVRKRQGSTLPPASGLEERLAGPIDAELGHLRVARGAGRKRPQS